MYYTEEIKKYLEIIKDYNISISPEKSNLKAKCTNCENRTSFTIDNVIKSVMNVE